MKLFVRLKQGKLKEHSILQTVEEKPEPRIFRSFTKGYLHLATLQTVGVLTTLPHTPSLPAQTIWSYSSLPNLF